MKYLLTSLLFLCSVIGKGQEVPQYEWVKETGLTTDSSTNFPLALRLPEPKPTFDTVLVIGQVCDTDKIHIEKYYIYATMLYGVRKSYYGMSSVVGYLTKEKLPLPKSLIVWQSFEINPKPND